MQLTGTLLLLVALGAPREGTVLGVAEEFPSGDWGSPVVPQVRVGFRRIESGWQVLSKSDLGEAAQDQPSEPGRGKMRWSVCFDGRVLGRLETEPLPSAGYHSRESIHVPVANQRIPFRGERTGEFGGWTGADVHHPLVLSSHGHCGDPDRWQRAQASSELNRRLVDFVRRTVVTEVCLGDVRTTWHPRGDDVEFLKLYVSKTGERLAMLRARPPDSDCDPPDPQSDVGAVQLLRIDRTGVISLLGSGLSVVDAGDYDGDGKSEVLVKYERYNNDGYTMFYDGFSKYVSLGWNYH